MTAVKAVATVLSCLVILALLYVAYVLFFSEDNYRQGMDYALELKMIEHDFRSYFHNKTEYPALSLEELYTQGILSKESQRILTQYKVSYKPFDPVTPGKQVVLSIQGYWREPDMYTKNDLTASSEAPDRVDP